MEGVMNTSKTFLRPIEKSDLKKLNKWKNDKEIFKYLGGGFQPISIDQQSEWLDSMIDLTGNNKRYIIEDENHMAIGVIGLYGISWIHRAAEIGMYIGEEEAHGNGYGTEAYEIIENYAKNFLNLRKLKLNVVYTNEKAVGFWEKLGYSKIGYLSQERYIDGQYHDLFILEKFLNKKGS